MLSRALPIAISYFFISMAFGVIASKYLGYYSIFMSMFVFAGATQFIAIKMIESGTGVAVIILTTFLVNSRHLLMSSYMSKFFEGGLALLKITPIMCRVYKDRTIIAEFTYKLIPLSGYIFNRAILYHKLFQQSIKNKLFLNLSSEYREG